MICPDCKTTYEPEKENCPFCGSRNPDLIKVSQAGEKKLIFIAAGLLLVISCILVFFFVIQPSIEDNKAERLFVIANNLKLRSSEYIDVSNSNVLREIPFGTEVIVYDQTADWATVKVKKVRGYMGSPSLYLKDRKSYLEINAIYGNDEARSNLKSSRIKQALLDYFRQNYIYGKLPEAAIEEFGMNIRSSDIWQAYGLPDGVKYNICTSGFFLGTEEECDAVIIKNNESGKRRLLIFSYIEDKPTFRFQMDFPDEFDGISSINKSTRVFLGKTLKGKQVMEKPKCDAIEFGSNDVFNVARKKILVYNGMNFSEYVQQ